MKKIRRKKLIKPVKNDQAPFFSPIQTKLSVGQPGDVHEKEADATADKVVDKTSEKVTVQKKGREEEQIQEKSLAESVTSVQKMEAPKEEEPIQKQETEEQEPIQMQNEEEKVQKQEEEEEQIQSKSIAKNIAPIQKMDAPKEEEKPVQNNEDEAEKEPAIEEAEKLEDPIQKMEEEESVQAMEEEEPVQAQEEEEPIQAKANGRKGSHSNFETKLKNHNGNGSPMDTRTRIEMESGFGTDLNEVKIHTGSGATNLNEDLGAHAFTHGKDVYFNEGKYDPSTKEGKHLLAHELTHTIQQTGISNSETAKKNPQRNRTNHSFSKVNNSIQKKDTESSDLQRLRKILEWWDVPENELIELFGELSSSEANIALTDSRIKSRSLRVHTNWGIYMSMNKCKGSLSLKLTWLIDEGTHVDYVKDVIKNSNGGDYQAVLNDQTLKMNLANAIGPNEFNEVEKMLKEGQPELEPSQEAIGSCIVEQTQQINEGHTASAGIHYPDTYRSYAIAYDSGNAETLVYKPFHDFWKEDYAVGYANSEYWTRNSYMNWTLKEDQLASEAIQDWLKGLTIAECASALVAVELETVRKVIGDLKFNQLFSKAVNPEAQPLNIGQSAQDSSLADVIDFDTESSQDPGTFGNRNVNVGEWHYFSNHPAHVLKHPSSFYQGENAIYMGEENGEQLWSGLGVKSTTELKLLEKMASEYNEPRSHTDYYYLVNGPVLEKEDYDPNKDYQMIYYDNLDKIPKQYHEDGGVMPIGDIDPMDIIMDPALEVQGTLRKGGFVPGVGKRLKLELIEQL